MLMCEKSFLFTFLFNSLLINFVFPELIQNYRGIYFVIISFKIHTTILDIN